MQPSVRTLSAVFFVLLSACGNKVEEVQPPPSAMVDLFKSAVEVACTYAPSQSTLIATIAATAGGTGVAAAAVGEAAGLTVVFHSSGAYIFTGPAGYIAGTLGTAVTGPLIIGVGVIVGGTAATVELLCVPKNHPELYAKVEAAAGEFYKRTTASLESTVTRAGPIAAELKASVIRTGSDACEYAYRSSLDVAKTYQKRL